MVDDGSATDEGQLLTLLQATLEGRAEPVKQADLLREMPAGKKRVTNALAALVEEGKAVRFMRMVHGPRCVWFQDVHSFDESRVSGRPKPRRIDAEGY